VPGSQSNPARTYAEAVSRVDALTQSDPADVGYKSRFYGQGSKTATAVVLFHGFTNNPKQWQRIAEDYAKAGYNVYVPRAPEHGARDVMSGDLAGLRLADLTAYADSSVDIAAGLGDHVQLVGISGGATLAAWAAQHRDEVTAVTVISPFFKPLSVPRWQVKPLYQITPHLPPIWQWWDAAKKASRNAPPYSYPRYTLASIATFMAIADKIGETAYARKTPIRQVTVVTNAADDGVDNAAAIGVLQKALKPHALVWITYEYPRDLGYKHDVISPEGDNKTAIGAIYAKLLPLLGLAPQPSVGATSTP
jgi:pimeloyl-ACP methyl ester carboxylesterase